MATASDAPQQGFQWAGGNGTGSVVRGVRFDSADHGGQWAGNHVEPPESRGIRARGIAYGGGTTPGALFGPTTVDAHGGQWDGPVGESVDSLLDTEGFALVLESRSGSDRLAFSRDEPAYREIKTVSWVAEVNAMASWSATVPMNPDLFSYPFSRAILGYNGERRFHGTLLPIEHSEIREGELTIGGYGPLFWAGHDDIEVSYSDMAAWRALEDCWLRVARATDGRVRGTVVRPRPGHANDHWIPPATDGEPGVSWEGTPLEVLKKAHGYAGMAFAINHEDEAGIATSFVPGEELRDAEWRTTSIKPAISPEGYHNRIHVVGNGASATATAPQHELDAVMDGAIHGRTVRDSELASVEACQARANTLLAEDRGEYTVGGSLDVTPTRAVPGYTYRVESFDPYVPDVFSPVWCSLRSIEHSYGPGEATTTLDFSDESRLVEHIRADLAPDGAPTSIKRRDAQTNRAEPNYDEPAKLVYAFGAGAWGAGAWGAAGEPAMTPNNSSST